MPATPTAQVGGARTTAGKRRADAERNIAAILDAALACLARDPNASIADIAQAAGVGRMTLYGHFRTRADLVDGVLTHVLAQSDTVLATVDTDGDPRLALTGFIDSAWQLLHQFHAARLAAQRELPQERIRAQHDGPMRRVESLIERGRQDGVFRCDLSVSWLVTVFYSILHTASDECAAGRLDPDDAAGTITATVLAAFAASPAG